MIAGGTLARLRLPVSSFLVLGYPGPWLVVFTFLALHIAGYTTVEIWGLKFAQWEFLTILVAGWWLLNGKDYGWGLHILHSWPFYLAAAFTLWVGIEAFRSPDPLRGTTMFVMQARNLFLFYVFAAVLSSRPLTGKSATAMVVLGALVAAISLSLYALVDLALDVIQASPSLREGPGYELDRGALRLAGFAGDPNFYSIWLIPSLLLAVKSGSIPFKWITLAIMSLSLILAASRTVLIVFFISVPIMVLALAFLSDSRTAVLNFAKEMGLILVIAVVAAVGWSVGWSVVDGISREGDSGVTFGNVTDETRGRSELKVVPGDVVTRFTNTGDSRLNLWETTLGVARDNIWIGSGLRSSQQALGGAYSHNSYLDVLTETGLIGLGLWLGFIGIATFRCRRLLNQSSSAAAWVHSWIILLGCLMAFSLVYYPVIWVIAAILVGADWRGGLVNSSDEQSI